MRIKDIDNPETFQRLVHALFVAQYGDDFQVVDDRGGDFGNDGYIRSRRILLAIYCPEVRPTRHAKYTEKITHDLNRAQSLARDHGYAIETWAFVTPGDLREPVQRSVRDQAAAAGFVGTCLGEAYLRDLFLRHPHLHEQFPELIGPQLLERISRIEEGVSEVQALQREVLARLEAGPGAPELEVLGGSAPIPTPRVLEAYRLFSTDPQRALSLLDRVRLESNDLSERVMAGYFRGELTDKATDAATALAVVDATLPEAERLDDPVILSILKGNRGWLLNNRFVELDTYGYYMGRAAHQIGFPVLAEEQQREIETETHRLRDEADDLFRQAVQTARDRRAYRALSAVLQLHGSALTHRIILYQRVPELRQQVEDMVLRVRASHETSIRIDAALGDVRALAVAYHNYANDLRNIANPMDAVIYAERALELEQIAGLQEETAKTRELLRRISGGISNNATRLIVAASRGENRFANRFAVHYRPDFVRMGDVTLQDADVIIVLDELRRAGLAEPESDDGVHGGLWRLTARGVEFARRYSNRVDTFTERTPNP